MHHNIKEEVAWNSSNNFRLLLLLLVVQYIKLHFSLLSYVAGWQVVCCHCHDFMSDVRDGIK